MTNNLKKNIILMLIMVVVFSVGCSSNKDKSNSEPELYESDEYTIICENENYYMSFIMKNKENIINEEQKNDDIQDAIIAPSVNFNSIKEMKDAIKNNKFTSEQVKCIKSKFKRDEAGRIKLCNPDKLYEPTLPTQFEDFKIYLHGERYDFLFTLEDNISCSFFLYDEERYHKEFEQRKYFYEDEHTVLNKTESVSDRNATVFYYTTAAEMPRKDIHYTLSVNEKNCIYLNHIFMSDPQQFLWL